MFVIPVAGLRLLLKVRFCCLFLRRFDDEEGPEGDGVPISELARLPPFISMMGQTHSTHLPPSNSCKLSFITGFATANLMYCGDTVYCPNLGQWYALGAVEPWI
jgi:hypothetical protein